MEGEFRSWRPLLDQESDSEEEDDDDDDEEEYYDAPGAPANSPEQEEEEMEEKPQGNNNNGEAFGLGPELLLFISLPLAQDNNVGRRRPEDGQMFCVGGGGGNYD